MRYYTKGWIKAGVCDGFCYDETYQTDNFGSNTDSTPKDAEVKSKSQIRRISIERKLR